MLWPRPTATAGSEIVIRYGDAGEIKAKFE